jgi:site-specific recombinase XerD
MDTKEECTDLVPVQTLEVITATRQKLEDIVATWLGVDVSNGDATADTLRTYRCQFQQWVDWCKSVRGVEAFDAKKEDVRAYRQFLVKSGAKQATISLKLVTIRRFYQAAVDRKILSENPAAEVKAPRNRKSKDKVVFLSAGEAELFFRAIPKDEKLRSLRDRAISALMLLEGLRRVEIERANTHDLEPTPGGGTRMLVHGKGKEDYIYPRKDTIEILQKYLRLRGDIDPDEFGQPLFVQVNKGGRTGKRLSRMGINWIIVSYLQKAGLKKAGSACHGLRHTCGFLLYVATKDVKVVQQTLRHSDITTAARYSHIVDRGEQRYTEAIALSV